MTPVTNTDWIVPRWFERFYTSAYFWVVVCTGCILLAAVFIVIAYRLWYDTKEVRRFLKEQEEADRTKDEF